MASSIPFHISPNAKKASVRGIAIGVVIIIAYLVIVIVTTPSLDPFLAIKAAFAMNSIIIFGMAIGVGLQFFISSYQKGLGYCKLDGKASGSNTSRRVLTGSATGSSSTTAISSFFSFFSLVPLGCCGSWLLILSFLPSVFGSSLSVALIQYSKPLSYAGLAIVFGFTALSAFKLHRELKQIKKEKVFKRLRRGIQGLDLKLFVNKKSALVIATSIIIVISIVVIAIVNIARTNSINFYPSNTNTDLPDKGNFLPLSSLSIGQFNAQKEEELQKHIVSFDQIVSGGPPPDGIPSIDNPTFVTVQEAGKNFLSDSDLVLGLNINGDIRAYPLLILVWHEIVNDRVAGIPVAITYCPLCFTNQVFNRTLNNNNEGQGTIVSQFGTSGKLYNSNLVMYDRTSKSLWSQALGQGIVGKYAGQKLQRIPFDIAYWRDWKQLYPNSKILSKNTGFSRPYGADPYGDYYTSNQVYFPVSNHDNRLGLKEKIVGLESGSAGAAQYKAYKLQQIETQKVINDEINGKPVTLFSLYPAMARVYERIVVGGKVLEFEYNNNSNKITDKQTGTEWNFDGKAVNGILKGKHLSRLPFDEGFWFEWVAFHPKTALYPC
jgi:hypothetical protein